MKQELKCESDEQYVDLQGYDHSDLEEVKTWTTTVQALQTSSGVQDILIDAPGSQYTANTGSNWTVNGYTRGTITWKLVCDLAGKTR